MSTVPVIRPPPAVWQLLNVIVAPARDCVGPPVHAGVRVFAATATEDPQTSSPRARARMASATDVTTPAGVALAALADEPVVPAVPPVVIMPGPTEAPKPPVLFSAKRPVNAQSSTQ